MRRFSPIVLLLTMLVAVSAAAQPLGDTAEAPPDSAQWRKNPPLALTASLSALYGLAATNDDAREKLGWVMVAVGAASPVILEIREPESFDTPRLALLSSLMVGLGLTNALVFDDETPELAVFSVTAGGLFSLMYLHLWLARDDDTRAVAHRPSDRWRLALALDAVGLSRRF